MISMKGNSSRNRAPANPSSIKTRFAVRFLQSLRSLNKKDGSNIIDSSKSRRYHSIRAASYASMASAVGPRRRWSRAILKKGGNHTINQFLMRRNRCQWRKRGMRREDELRQLVPGGSRMSPAVLLRETAHYIACLRTQVQVMTSILDQYSKSK